MTFQALLFCPDEKTARVTTQVLNELEFSVESCTEPFAAVKKLMGQHFDAIVVDCENEQNAALLFKSARNSSSNQGSLAVAVVEGQTGVANAFRIGANLVLTKPINVEQAKSTLRVARGLLRKGGESAKAMPGIPAGAPGGSTAPAQPATQRAVSPESPRPASPTTSMPKPAFAALQTSKPQPISAVAKTTVEAGTGYGVDKNNASATSDDDTLLEAIDDAPSSQAQAAAAAKPASDDFPWQSVTKPTGSMAAALQRAAEASKNKQPEVTVKAPSAPAKPASLAGSRPNVPLTAASATAPSGSAAAPAPAKEAAPQLPPAVTKASAPVLAPLSMESASAGLSKRESAAVPVPTFGALDGGSKEASEAGGSKKGILIVAAVAVLAIAGYFGYTKMARNRPAKEVAQVQAQAAPAAQVPAAETPSAPTTVVTAANPTQPPRTEAAATTKSLASTTAEDDTPEVVVTHPEPSKMIVMKSGIGSAAPKKKTEEAAVPDVPAPALGMGNEDQSAISNLMTSAPVTVPKVASTSSSSDVLRISQGVTQGLLLKRVQPVYPHPAMQMRLQGAVQLQATINKQGSITSVKVLSGDAILARAAVEAVNQWKYKPYFLNGEPVDIQTQITVNFKLP